MKSEITMVLISAVLLLGLLSMAWAADKKVKVFILAGQSNMEGHGMLGILDHLGTHPKYGHLIKKLKKGMVLCIVGKEEFALLRMYDRYKDQINVSTTTLWEHFGRWWQIKFDANSSQNHGWNSANTILSKYIAGVAPETAGWSTYHVLPKEAFLTAIKIVVNSVKGNITVDIKRKISEYSLHLSSPLNTKAIVGIPKGSFSKLNSIQVNGTTIRNGTYSGGVTGITWNGEDDKYVKFNADPGRWAFMAAGILPISSPKPPRAPRPKQTKLDKKTWAVSASITNTEPKMSYRWGKKDSGSALSPKQKDT